MVYQRGTIYEMLQEIQDEADSLAKHLFVANWQQDQFTQLGRSLPQNLVMLVLDFAENYSCISHWATQQITVHPIVEYYHCAHADVAKSHIAQEVLMTCCMITTLFTISRGRHSGI